jgi:hypothetical protein
MIIVLFDLSVFESDAPSDYSVIFKISVGLTLAWHGLIRRLVSCLLVLNMHGRHFNGDGSCFGFAIFLLI